MRPPVLYNKIVQILKKSVSRYTRLDTRLDTRLLNFFPPTFTLCDMCKICGRAMYAVTIWECVSAALTVM